MKLSKNLFIFIYVCVYFNLGLRCNLSYSWKHAWSLYGFFDFTDFCPLFWHYFLRYCHCKYDSFLVNFREWCKRFFFNFIFAYDYALVLAPFLNFLKTV